QYAPTRGRFKVYVIDEVHQLSGHAFNAMLKTLEEPPEHMKFILATTDPQKIPVTVLSRCLQFNLKQMPREAIASHLGFILDQERIAAEPEALSLIARAASGSMRDALSLLDQAIAHGGGKVTAAGVSEMLGAIDQGYLVSLLERVAAEDAPGAVALADEMQSRSLSFDAALADLASLLLRIALSQSVPGALEAHAERARLEALAAQVDAETIQLYYQIALQGREDLPLAPDEHAGFLMTVLRMLAFRPETAAVQPVKPASQTRPRPAQSSGEWPQLARELPVTGAARELARNAELRRHHEGAYELVVPKAKAYLAERSYVDKLKAALDQHLGRPVRVSVTVGDVAGATAAAVEAGEREARQAEAVKSVQGDGFVQDLVSMFDAKLVDSSIRSNGREDAK
ncbi:MAG TPA: DNA polymerase III subunit gamma/tau C-terminal domain-containing protein, partial [Burkholderiales bacterium]|nr:DNA polymerase III subunit gamma/tau C-terminal domain-containing protein [Burkholderiales bacterium]